MENKLHCWKPEVLWGGKLSVSAYLDKLKKSEEENRTKSDEFLSNLRTCDPYEVSRYTHLYCLSIQHLFIIQARIQASISFRVAIIFCVVGLILISAGIVMLYKIPSSIEFGLVASISGMFTELVSATVFLLYKRTIDQVNAFSKKMMATQKEAYGNFIESSYAKLTGDTQDLLREGGNETEVQEI